MRVEIIGGGSIGLLLASKLAASGSEVTVWTRTMRQSESIQAQGIRLIDEDSGIERVIPVSADWLNEERLTESNTMRRGHAWILLAVKQTAIDEKLMKLVHKRALLAAEGASVVCIQNGIGHLEKLAAVLGGIPLYAAVTTEGAKREDERTVRHTGKGQLILSEHPEDCRIPDEKDAFSQKMFLLSLQKAGFEVFLSNDMRDPIYQKLLINAVINPLTAIFDVVNGELPRHKKHLGLMKGLHDETKRVLVKAGMTNQDGSWRQVLDVCERTRGNVSSMLGDLRAGRKTEIASINGAVARLAASVGIKAPLNEAVVAMIEVMERESSGGEDEYGRNMG